MRNSAPIRVAISSGVALVHHGLRSLMADHPSGEFQIVDGTPLDWTPATVDALILDLTHYGPPPPHHFAPVWVHRVPTLGLVADASARSAALALGCHGWLAVDASSDQFNSAATALRAHPKRAAPVSHWLSWRELQVVHLVSTGNSNREIARRLVVSNNTVKTYVRQAYRKIGATTRSRATLWSHLHSVASESARDTLFAASVDGVGPGVALRFS